MSVVTKLDDNDLLEAALDHEQRAWRELVRRHDPTMHEIAREATSAFGVDDSRVEDIVADAWLAMLEDDMRRLRAFDPARGVPVGAWLALQATRAASRYLRQQAKLPEFVSLDEVEELPDPRTIELTEEPRRLKSRSRPAAAPTIDSAIRQAVSETVRDVVRDEVRAAMREQMASAPTSTQADEYLSIADAAKLAGVHEATIRSWISRGQVPGYHAGRHRRVKRVELEGFMSKISEGDAVDIDARAAKLAAI